MRKIIYSLLFILGLTLIGSPAALADLPPNPYIAFESEFPDGFGQQGGTYTVTTTSDPNFLNPFLATGDSASRDVTDPIGLTSFTALIDSFASGSIPALAEAFEVDDVANPGEITFTLRDGLKWNDGTDLTLDDVEFTWRVNTDPRFVEIARSDGLMINDQFPTFERVDDRTFKLVLPGPVGIDGYLGQINALFILPKHKLAEAAALDDPANQSPDLLSETFWSPQFAAENPGEIVGAGPYRLKSAVVGQEWVFERNPYYYKTDENGTQLPYFDEYRILIVENRDVELLKYLNGETDSLAPRPSDLPVIQQRKTETPGFEIDIDDPSVTGTANFISFNQDIADPNLKQLFRNKTFRAAMAHALDRQAIADTVFLGLAVPIFGPSGLGVYDITGRPGSGGELDPEFPMADFELDFDKANEMLDSIDLPIGEDGFRVFGESYPEPGVPVELVITTNEENNLRVDTVVLIAQDWNDKLHIKTTPNPIPFNAFVSDLLKFIFTGGEQFGEWEVAHIGISGGGDPTFVLVEETSGGFLHFYRYSDNFGDLSPNQQRLDEIFAEQAAIPTPCEVGDVIAGHEGLACGIAQERFDLVREAQLIIAEEKNILYTTSSQILRSWRSDRVANILRSDLPEEFETTLSFLERGYRVDL